MKHIKTALISIVITIAFTACHPVVTEQQTLTADSLLTHMMRAIFDTNVSCLDYQDEFMMFMDTIQMHVESYPDEDIRIGAKSFAMELFGLFAYGDFTTPEENRFFGDSLLLRLMDIQSTWYLPAYVPDGITDPFKEPILTQTIAFRYGNNENHVICMDLYFFPSGDEGMVVTLPVEAKNLASIVFRQENMLDIDTTLNYTIAEARDMQDRSDELGQVIWFGKDFIEAMLSHEGMYIAYVGTEEAEDITDRIHKCHLDLKQFHKQYQHVKQLMNR